MYAFGQASRLSRSRATTPSEELKIGVTFRRPDGGPGLTKFAAPLSNATVQRFIPDPLQADKTLYEMARLGFTVTQRGKLTASVRGTRAQFERAFGTKLSKFQLDPKQNYSCGSFYFPADGAPWSPSPILEESLDDAYIQWPHIFMSPRVKARAKPRKRRAASMSNGTGPSATPPTVGYYHLEVPNDVPDVLNATRVHRAGTTGQGVRIVMVDSGFAHGSHPYFESQGYRSSVDLAPRATNDKTDPNGHGTGESANVFAVAPKATFIGVKVDNDDDPPGGASLLEGFQTALLHGPKIITVSMGYDLRQNGRQMSELPGSLAALEAEVQAAVASGVVVIFSAGNGHFSFPGMMPDVISAGGVFVDQHGVMQASDYASAFNSKIYAGRHVPDFCGLVGMQPHAAYIMLPIPPRCEIDRDMSDPGDGEGDETAPDDGWSAFSGTSAAAPQLAGVCALLLEKNPSLMPSDIKAVLRRTSRDVLVGSANRASSDGGNNPKRAGAGDDGATGAGLVDAFAAWEQV